MTGTTEADRRITGVGTASDSADAVNAVSIQNNRLTYALASATGKTYAVSLKVAPQQYMAGMMVSFKTPGASVGFDSLNINNLGARVIYKNVTDPLLANDIVANQVVSVMYDGSAFQVISQLRSSSSFSGVLSGEVTGTQSATIIANNAVTAGKIADNAVTTNKVADNAITDAKLAGGISYGKLSLSNSIIGSDMTDGSIRHQ
jgi:hypothetical protein